MRAIYYFYIEIHLQYHYYTKLLKFQYDKENEMEAIDYNKKEVANEGEKPFDVEVYNIIPFQTANKNKQEDNNQDSFASKDNISKFTSSKFDSKSKFNNNIFDLSSSSPNPSQTKLPLTPQTPSSFSKVASNNTQNNQIQLTTVNTANILNTNENRLSGLIDHTKKKRPPFEISYCELFSYKYFHCCKSEKEKANSKIRNQIIFQAEHEIDKRVDTLNVFQLFEQFKIIKQILLNQNQCYMLDNKGKQIIYNKKISSKSDYSKVMEEKKLRTEEKLIAYLKEKKEKNQVNEVDILLFNLMEEDIKLNQVVNL